MKYFLLSPFLLAVLSAVVYFDIKDSAYSGGIKQDVIAITTDGTVAASNIRTLERPIITRRGIQKKLKEDMVNFFSFPIGNINSHLDEHEQLFSKVFFSTYKPHIKATVDNLIDSEVRVVDFLIYGEPIYLGSKRAGIRNWQFMIEGYNVYQGNFSRSPYQFVRSTKVITVIETKTRNGNPSGVEIFKVEEF